MLRDDYSMADPPQPGDYLVRNVMGFVAASGALAVGDVVAARRRLRFHVRDRDSAAEDLRTMLSRYALAKQFSKGAGAPPPMAAVLVQCVGRGERLFGCPDHDSSVFSGQFDVPLGGFFANGEIAPTGCCGFEDAAETPTHLHGFTSAYGLLVDTTETERDGRAAASPSS